jgi:D-beta-D-heptose 7-phosphate kinase/D-beta-D-heptose 1-phosphate adenosyltransferase
LVQALAPDVIVKGGDYRPETVVGAEVVRARGGRVVIIPLTPGQSTTSILEKLRAHRPA